MRSLIAFCAAAVLAAGLVASALAGPARRIDRTGKPDVIPPRNPKLSEDDIDISRSRKPRNMGPSGETKRLLTAVTFQNTSESWNKAFQKDVSKRKKFLGTECKRFPKMMSNTIVTCTDSSRKCEATCKKGYRFEDYNENILQFICLNGQWVHSSEKRKGFPRCKIISRS